MLCQNCLGLVFTGRYQSNSVLPHCPAILSFCSVMLVTVKLWTNKWWRWWWNTVHNEPCSVDGRAGDTGGSTLKPGVVVGSSGRDVKRRPGTVRLYTVLVISTSRQHASVFLPADHRQRHADRLGREVYRLALAYCLVLEAFCKAWCRHHRPSCRRTRKYVTNQWCTKQEYTVVI